MQRYGILIFWLALTSVLSHPTTTAVPNGNNQASDSEVKKFKNRGINDLVLEAEKKTVLKYLNLTQETELSQSHIHQFLMKFWNLSSLNDYEKKVVDDFAKLKLESLQNHTRPPFLLNVFKDFVFQKKYLTEGPEEKLDNLEASVDKDKRRKDREFKNLMGEAVKAILKEKPRKCTEDLEKKLHLYYDLGCDGEKIKTLEILEIRTEAESKVVLKYLNLTQETELSQSHIHQFLMKFWNLSSLNDYEKKVVDEFVKHEFEAFKNYTKINYGLSRLGDFVIEKQYRYEDLKDELGNLQVLIYKDKSRKEREFQNLMVEAVKAVLKEKPRKCTYQLKDHLDYYYDLSCDGKKITRDNPTKDEETSTPRLL